MYAIARKGELGEGYFLEKVSESISVVLVFTSISLAESYINEKIAEEYKQYLAIEDFSFNKFVKFSENINLNSTIRIYIDVRT